MIAHVCPHCNALTVYPDALAGRQTSCDRCREPIELPHNRMAEPTSEAGMTGKWEGFLRRPRSGG